MTHILIAEDDKNLGFLLQDHLEDNNFKVTRFVNGVEAWEAYSDIFDLCIIDVMMPEMDGFTLVKNIRQKDEKTPIIFLTAKSLKADRIEGFKIGADDYLTKPFSMEELLLRISAILRRSGASQEKKSTYILSSFSFDVTRQVLKSGLEEQKLTAKESELLAILCENLNKTTPREDILKRVWGDDSYYNARSMDVYLSKLRKLLKTDDQIELINVHGRGFKLIVNKLA